MRVRTMAACIAAALLAGAPVSAHVRDFGFYSVHGRSHGMDYIDEVRGKANMIVWSYDDLTLDTDFPQRIAAAPKLRLLLTLPLNTAALIPLV